jgi:hypothetical protein
LHGPLTGLRELEPLRRRVGEVTGSIDRALRSIEARRSVDGIGVTLFRAETDAQLLGSTVDELHNGRYLQHVDDFADAALVRFDRNGDGAIDPATESTATERTPIYDRMPWLVRTFDARDLVSAVDALGNRDGLAQRDELLAVAMRRDADHDGWLTLDAREQLDRELPLHLRETKSL